MPNDSSPLPRTTASPPPPLPFTCARREGPGSISVHPSGELDLANLAEFRAMLRAAQADSRSVSIDLRELTFIDCAALGAIIEARNFAQRGGGSLTLVPGSGQVRRIFELSGVGDAVELVEPERPISGAASTGSVHAGV